MSASLNVLSLRRSLLMPNLYMFDLKFVLRYYLGSEDCIDSAMSLSQWFLLPGDPDRILKVFTGLSFGLSRCYFVITLIVLDYF